VKPPDEDKTEPELLAACLALPPASQGTDDQPARANPCCEARSSRITAFDSAISGFRAGGADRAHRYASSVGRSRTYLQAPASQVYPARSQSDLVAYDPGEALGEPLDEEECRAQPATSPNSISDTARTFIVSASFSLEASNLRACGQAAVRSHTRTDRIAARIVSSEPEIENLDPLSRVVVSRRQSCALHHSAMVCLRSYPYGPK